MGKLRTEMVNLAHFSNEYLLIVSFSHTAQSSFHSIVRIKGKKQPSSHAPISTGVFIGGGVHSFPWSP